MGYLTSFAINKLQGRDSDYDALLKDIKDFNGIDFTNYENDEGKWDNVIQDMERLTKKYPGLLVELEGRGENWEDHWTARFIKGESECVSAEFKPFKEILTKAEKKELKQTVNNGLKDMMSNLKDAAEKEIKGIFNRFGRESIIIDEIDDIGDAPILSEDANDNEYSYILTKIERLKNKGKELFLFYGVNSSDWITMNIRQIKIEELIDIISWLKNKLK